MTQPPLRGGSSKSDVRSQKSSVTFGAGTRIGCYEIVDVLGAGGMGEVYRARDNRAGVLDGDAAHPPIEGTIHPIAQRNYDIMPDGKRLLVVLPAPGPTESARRQTQQAVVVLNWFDELKTRVPVK